MLVVVVFCVLPAALLLYISYPSVELRSETREHSLQGWSRVAVKVFCFVVGVLLLIRASLLLPTPSRPQLSEAVAFLVGAIVFGAAAFPGVRLYQGFGGPMDDESRLKGRSELIVKILLGTCSLLLLAQFLRILPV